jgi:hypothetical protein
LDHPFFLILKVFYGRILTRKRSFGFVGFPPKELVTLEPRGEPGFGD